MPFKFEQLTKADKVACFNKLFRESSPSLDFFMMLVLSSIIVSFGLLINNSSIIIGGMLIAPILFPILSLSMGVVASDFKLIRNSFVVMIKSLLIVLAISLLISLLMVDRQQTAELLARTYPTLVYFMIALVSGIAASYALTRPNLSEILPGVAIAVSLLPPLASVGAAISFFNWRMTVGALGLFSLNFLGIVFGSLIVFSILNFYEIKKTIAERIKAEEMSQEKEEKAQQKIEIKQIEKQIKEVSKILEGKKKEA